MAEDSQWQELATKLRFAILACQFADGNPSLYQNDDRGSVAKAINIAVVQLATESKHPELAKAPLAFWGTSAGSNVSSRYCKHFPERVAAFTSSKGTWGPSGDLSRSSSEIPMFFAIGQTDKEDWVTGSLKNIEQGRKGQTPWTFAVNAREGHDVGGSLNAIIPFLEAAVNQRLEGGSSPAGESGSIFKSQLPAIGATTSTNSSQDKLRKIKLTDGWLGDPKTFEIAPHSQFKGSKNNALWLPDEATAKAWQAYLRS